MYLARLKRYNPTLNCVVTLTEERAMNEARQADQEIAAGKYRGPLHGIPWGCKDLFAVPGYPTQWGSPAFKGQVFDYEATVARLLREAGAVLLAKLATGAMGGGDRWFGGRTNNPWDPTEGSSGSSAGSASATAAGLVAFGNGSETIGSILSPASICGVSGLRPTFGRVSRYGAMTLSWTLDRVGPLCRTVEDCALVFRAIAQPDEQDLTVLDLPFNWDAGLDVRKLRVGYLQAAFRENDREEDWKNNDQRVLEEVRSIGVRLEPFDLPELPESVVSPIGVEATTSLAEFRRNTPSAGSANLNRLVPAFDYLRSQRVRTMIMRRFAEVVSKFDVFIAPFINMRAADGPAIMAGRARQVSVIGAHFRIANLCTYPAISVPNGFTGDGKPTSITFMGRLFGEAEMLALAKAYQDRSGWHLMHPKLS
jgi:Asp-tRNA(Asn)/Glu-tRNA(Gln) amidotransferase A subunit family amidase